MRGLLARGLLALGLLVVALGGCGTGESASGARTPAPIDARDALLAPSTVARALGSGYAETSAGEMRLAGVRQSYRSCRSAMGVLRWITSARWVVAVETSTTSHVPDQVAAIISAAAHLKRSARVSPATLVARSVKRCGGTTRRFSIRDGRQAVSAVEFVFSPPSGREKLTARVTGIRSKGTVVLVFSILVGESHCARECADQRLLRDGLRRGRRALARRIRKPTGGPRFLPVVCKAGRCRPPRTPG